MKKHIRRNWRDYKRLGGKKKKQVWRKARGRHSKIREKRKGRPRKPEIGEKKAKKVRGKIRGLNPVVVRNTEDLKKIKQGEIIIIAKLGKRKKQEILNEAEKMNLVIFKNKQTKRIRK